ncbi:MAG: hypothetical protein JRI94_11955 [Deltaproteobacteria bacterium]|nr:hypothetical protein [Deltaproteobacteria bacterium]MBW2034280.1 hypothetical protein [Deltaproteobacteria bacterium]MBW2170057.1 hypothetical protein [Deltaproteobacteria bacterium]
MSFINKIKGIFGKGKGVNSYDVMLLAMGDICSNLVKHFKNEYYRWNESENIKTFECLVLSRFLLDYALLKTFSDKLDKIRMEFYSSIIDHQFKSLLENTFQDGFTYNTVKDSVDNRLKLYKKALSENPHPRCWQLLAAVLTGTDYYAEEDPVTLVASSSIIPELIMHAQDSLQRVIKP